MKINDCTMYRLDGTKCRHEIRIRPEYEDKLAALMMDKNQTVNEAIESAIKTAFNQYSQEKRRELLTEAEILRKEQQ